MTPISDSGGSSRVRNAPESVRHRFAAARVARLATADATGTPHIVPIVFATLPGERLVSAVDAKPKTTQNLRRLQNIQSNPRVAVLVDEYDDEDWARLWWVRADGAARIVRSGPEYTDAVAALRAKYRQYRGQVGINGPVVVVDVERWRSWSMPAPDH